MAVAAAVAAVAAVAVAAVAVAAGAGVALGVHDAKKEIRKRGVYGVERKDVGPKSLLQSIKSGIKQIKKK